VSLHIDHEKLGAHHSGPAGRSPPSPTPPKQRGAVSTVTISSLSVIGLIILVIVIEHLAPGKWKPSTYIGAFGGKKQTVEILESFEATRALVAMQEEERARAMMEIEQYRAAQQRLTLAYQVEFERGNEMIRAGAAAAQEILRNATMAKMEGMKGRLAVSSKKDEWGMLCDLGNFLFQTPDCGDKLRLSAENDRNAMQAEIINGWKSANAQIAGMARDWAAGLLTPAELITEAKTGNPQLFVAPRNPLPPNPYRSE
jgi:hypothetical protein